MAAEGRTSLTSRGSIDFSSLDIWGSVRSSSTTIASSLPEHHTYVGFANERFSRTPTLDGSPAQGDREDDDEAMKWAAIERLPTSTRLRTAIFQTALGSRAQVLDVTKLTLLQGEQFIDKLLREDPDDDNEHFLQRLRNRIDRYAS
jgi:hypothetical protein